jgi:hypothetical protein
MTKPTQSHTDPSDSAKQRLKKGYESLVHKTKEIYSGAEKKSEVWFEEALEKSRQSLQDAGEFSKEETQQLRDYLRRDLQATEVDFRRWSEQARKQLEPTRVGTGFLDLVSSLLEGTSNVLDGLGQKVSEALTYKTGEMTGPGTLTCTSCKKEMHFDEPGHIPPCAGCKGTAFRKHY